MEPQDVSKRIGGLVGPVLMALTASEFPLVQPHLYDAQIPPVVYLSGTLLFVAGLAVVRAHSRWVLGWPGLVTLVGWLAMGLGLVRMFAASALSPGAASAPTWLFMGVEAALFCAGLVITVGAYRQ